MSRVADISAAGDGPADDDADPDQEPRIQPYLVHKAGRYLKVGPARYRKSDASGRPEADVHRDVLGAVRRAFEQLAAQRGATATEPLDDVGIRELNAVMGDS